MAIKHASGKAKGRKCQNWTAEQISNLLNLPWGKDEVIAPREMGQSGPDVRLVADAYDCFPFVVECKWCETWSVPAWIKQAKSHGPYDWLLIAKMNHKPYLAFLEADVLLDLVALSTDAKPFEDGFCCHWKDRWDIWTWFNVANEGSADRHGVLFIKRQLEDWIAVVDAEHFFYLLSTIPGKRKGRP